MRHVSQWPRVHMLSMKDKNDKKATKTVAHHNGRFVSGPTKKI